MRKLSAVEAISPAWNHTREYLIEPRNWRLVLKVGLFAVLSQMGSCNLNSSFPPSKGGTDMSAAVIGVLAVVIAVAVVFGIALGLLFFYLGSRLQFVFFEMVLRRDTLVGPMWRRYGPVTWRWMGLKFFYLLIALLCVVPFLVPSIIHIVHIFQSNAGWNNLSFSQGIQLALEIIIPVLLAVLVISAGYVIVFNFGLPFIALEGLTGRQTVDRLWSLLRDEPGAFAMYLVMLFVLSMFGGMVTVVAVVLVVGIACIPFGGTGWLLWASLHHAGMTGNIFMVLGFTVLGTLALALLCALVLVLSAVTRTFFQAYALYFLGGRYAQLGDRLDGFNPPLPPMTISPRYPDPYPPPPVNPPPFAT